MSERVRVLIVDDDLALCGTLSDVLEAEGYEAHSFHLGQPALVWAEKETPAVALIDLHLPDLPGLEVLKALKTVSPHTECIVLTGHTSQSSAIEAVNLGAYSYLPKPFDVDHLLLVIRRAVEKQEAARSLFESGERFRRLAENAQDFIYRYEFIPRRGFTYVSPTATAITGYTPEEHYADPDLGLKIVHPADRPLLEAYFQGQGTFRQPLVLRWLRKDGAILWVEQRNAPIYNEAGDLVAIEGVARDVTERKQAEEALRDALAELAAIHQNAPWAMLLVDRERRVRKVNGAAARFAGRPAEEMLGLYGGEALRCLHHLDDPRGCGFGPACAICPVRRAVLDTFADGQSRQEVEAWLPFPRGDRSEERCLLVSTAYLQVGGSERVLVCAQDITERKRAEQALEAERSLLRTLVDHLPDAVYVKDSACRKTLANPADLRNMGASTEAEVLGKTDFDFYPPDLAAAFYADDQSVIQSGQPIINREEMITLPDGSRGWQLTSKAPLRDSTGQVIGLVGIGHHITERKRAEEEVRQHVARLEALRQVSLELATELDLDRLLGFIVERATALVGGRRGSFLLYRPELEALVVTAMCGGGPDVRGTLLRRGEGLAGRVWESGRPLIVADYEHWEGRAAIYEGYSFRALVGVPVRWGDEFLGVLNVEAGKPGAFTPADAELLELFATQAAIAIHNSRLYRQAVQAAERLTILHRASQEIAGAFRDPEQVYQAIHRAATALMPVEAFVIVLHDEASEQNEAVYLIDKGGRWPSRFIPAGQGLSCRVIASGRSLLIDDFLAGVVPQAIHFGSPEQVRSILAVPLLSAGKTIGAISAQSYRPHAYTAQDQALLEMLAAHAAAILDNARLYQEAQRGLRDLTLLFESSVAFSESLDVDTVLHTAARQIATALGVEGCALSWWDREQDNLVLLLDYSPDPESWKPVAPGARYPLARYPLSRRVLTERQPIAVCVSDTEADPTEIQWMREEEVASLLMVPLVSGDRVIGLLELMEGQWARTFTPAEISLCQTLANQAAAALENARLYDEAQRRNRELALLNRVIAASAASQGVEPILETVCREMAQAFHVPRAVAILFDEGRQQASVAAEVRPPDRPSLLGVTMPIPDALLTPYLDRRQPVIVEEAQTDPRLEPLRYLLRQYDTASLLIVPLCVAEVTIGALLLGTRQPRRFSAEEVALVQRVADQVSGALARARLEETQQLLSTAIEQAAETVIITDAQDTILYVNPAFERITGYSRAEALGRTPFLLKSGRHDDAFYRDLWQTIGRGQVWQGRFTNRKKDGSLYTEEATVTPVRNPAGEIVNYVTVKRDVTRELQLEEQFRQAQKMEAVGRLAGGIAHDFNNLLTVIQLSTRLLEQGLHRHDPLTTHVQRIQDASQRAASLIKQLLTFSRREIVEPRVLNLNQVLGEMKEMLRRLIGEDVELTLLPAQDLWPVKIDLSQAEQVVINLVVNARDAMPDGGRLSIETANVTLDEAYAARHLDVEPGEYVLLAISDTGVGMTEEVKAHLFEPFFTTKEKGKGTGLGLATVFGIIKQHGGHIGVYSEVGLGTTFRIYLPRVEVEVEAKVAAKVEEESPSSVLTSTILLVEDDPLVLELTRDILLAQGYQVLTAGDGLEALGVAAAYPGPIHLLLTDVVMPRLGGRELADRLRSSRPEMQVLFTSGYTDDVAVRHGLLAEGIHFLSKPFAVEDLARKVRQVLEGAA